MKKAIILAALGLLGLAAVCSYANIHLYYRAKAMAGDPAGRIRLLEKADRFFPWNDLVHFELTLEKRRVRRVADPNEYPVARFERFFTGLDIAEFCAPYFPLGDIKDICHHGIPDELDFRVAAEAVLHDLGSS